MMMLLQLQGSTLLKHIIVKYVLVFVSHFFISVSFFTVFPWFSPCHVMLVNLSMCVSSVLLLATCNFVLTMFFFLFFVASGLFVIMASYCICPSCTGSLTTSCAAFSSSSSSNNTYPHTIPFFCRFRFTSCFERLVIIYFGHSLIAFFLWDSLVSDHFFLLFFSVFLFFPPKQELSRALKRDSKVEKRLHHRPPEEFFLLQDQLKRQQLRRSTKTGSHRKKKRLMQRNITGLLLKISQVYFPMNGILLPPAPPMTISSQRNEWKKKFIISVNSRQKRIPTEVLLLLWQTLLPNPKDLRFSTAVPFNPPRIDRAKKPERFKSAHERLFGKKSDVDQNGQNGVNGDATPNGSKRDSNRRFNGLSWVHEFFVIFCPSSSSNDISVCLLFLQECY